MGVIEIPNLLTSPPTTEEIFRLGELAGILRSAQSLLEVESEPYVRIEESLRFLGVIPKDITPNRNTYRAILVDVAIEVLLASNLVAANHPAQKIFGLAVPLLH